VKPKSPASGFRADGLGHDCIPKRATQTLAKPGDNPSQKYERPANRYGNQHLSERGEPVAHKDKDFTIAKLVGYKAGPHFSETGHGIGNALNDTQDCSR